MINAYYLLRDGEQTGPFTLYELQDFDLQPDTLVLSPLTTDWQEAGDLPEFATYFESRGIYAGHSTYAGFWWRLLAYIIDYIIIKIVLTIGSALIESVSQYTDQTVVAAGAYIIAVTSIGSFFAVVLYDAAFEASEMQGSIGKRICNLIVVDERGKRLTFGKALARNLGKILSSIICGIGYLNILWDDKSQGWHDQLAKTYVMKRS